MAEDRMLSDEILLGLIKANSGGGGGGTSNYNDLSNKPQIGGTTLQGNKTLSDLGIASASALANKVDKVDGKGLSTNDYTNTDKAIVGGVTAALAGKQNALTAGDHIEIDDDTISVNRWALPAGDVIYTVITGSGDYGREIHVQRYTVGGTLIDDREYHIDTWGSQDVDDKIRLAQGYAQWNISLLTDSKEHSSGYSYNVNPNTTETSNSFTFTLTQEENANDLIIRSELDAALATKADLTDLAPAFSTSTAYTVGQYVSYDGNIYKCTSAHSAGAWVAGDFTLVAVGSELESKQNATDNSLQTTDKTVVGAVNELKSGLTNLTDDVKLNTQDLTTPSRTKNLLNYDEWKKVNVIGGSGVFENNGITLTATDDCYTGYNNTDFPVNARIPISEGETITLSWQANNDLSGIQYIFPNGSVSGAVSKNNANGKSLSYTAGSGVTYVTFRFGVGDAGNSIEYSNIQIEKGNTATSYAPYIPSVESRIEAVESGLTNYLKTTSFSGTTDQYGNIELDNNRNIVSVYSNANVCIPLEYNSKKYIKVLGTQDMQPTVNQLILGVYTYIG